MTPLHHWIPTTPPCLSTMNCCVIILVPDKLQVDRGTEFRGELIHYCKCLGIEKGPIAMLNPCANGMVGYLVGTCKAVVSRCMAAWSNSHW